MTRFKVGDLVIGNEKANIYCVTKEGWIGKVTQIGEGAFMAMGEDGRQYALIYEYFDLLPPKLETCQLVKLKNGDWRIVVNTEDKGLVLFNPENGKCCEVKNYNTDYENIGSLGHDFDIMEIYGLPKTQGQGGILDLECTDNRQLVYKRQEAVEMTLQKVNDMLIGHGLPPVKIIE